jgi:hypothetical protein
MARSTQYIGLSKEAHRFLNEHVHKTIGTWRMSTGIAGEDVTGNIYEVDEGECMGERNIRTYVEVEQCSPWSSGPMIHTCLMSLPYGKLCYMWNEKEIHYE